MPLEEAPLPLRPVGTSEAKIHQIERDLVQMAEVNMCDRLEIQLEEQGYDVFFEVPIGVGRPDVVAIRGEETVGIEAKRRDIKGVVKQGLRLARYVDRAYVAVPITTLNEVTTAIDRLARTTVEKGRTYAIPGIISVGPSEIKVMRAPIGEPSERIPTAELRRAADLVGEEQGGVPGGDRSARNLAIWTSWAGGLPVVLIARRQSLPTRVVRRILTRVARWSAHLETCDGSPCRGDALELEAHKGAHVNTAIVLALPMRPIADLDEDTAA